MLKAAKSEACARIENILSGATGAKIGGLVAAYGLDSSLLQVWYDENSTVVSRFDGAMTVYCDGETDFDELSGFIRAVGCTSLFTDAESLVMLGFKADLSGAVMRCTGCEDCGIAEDAGGRLRELYTVISENIPGSFDEGSYNYFLSDFTYRQRRSLARASCVTVGGKISACALTSAETAHSAVISGVACVRECRGTGYGRLVVSSLARELMSEGKAVYVFALNERACGFYEHIGFSRCGEWAQSIF